ncbi:unnamed protein product [Jaminaea pallidilutea]
MASASSSLLKCLVVPPASGQAATATLIFAHGLGDSSAGWVDVARMLSSRPALRHVRFVLPNAPVQPVTLNMGMSMPSWFDITTLEDIEEGEDEKGLQKSAADITKLVKAEIEGTAEGLNGKGMPADRVVVGGFSQVSRLSRRVRAASLERASSLPMQRLPSSSPPLLPVQRRSSTSASPRHQMRAHNRGFKTGADSLAAETISSCQARIVGTGVDILHLPRLGEMVRRRPHASGSPLLCLRRFARKVLCEAEIQEMDELSDVAALEKWLAVRWTAKEAAYKAVYPLRKLRWSDLCVYKAGPRPLLRFSDDCNFAVHMRTMRLHLSGGAISYLAGLTHSPPVGGIVALSTWLPMHRKVSSMVTPQAKNIPTFHAHGSSDQIVQFQFGKRSVDYLRDDLGMGAFTESAGNGGKPKGLRFEVYKGMAHSACPEEIEHVGQFLEKVVPA